MRAAIMLNKPLLKQTLVAILLARRRRSPTRRTPGRRCAASTTGGSTAPPGPARSHTAVAGADGSEVLRLARPPGEPPRSRSRRRCRSTCPTGSRSRSATAPAAAAAWRTCGPAGCEAPAAARPPSSAAALRRERRRQRHLHARSTACAVRLPFSLIGYTAALRAAGGASVPQP